MYLCCISKNHTKIGNVTTGTFSMFLGQRCFLHRLRSLLTFGCRHLLTFGCRHPRRVSAVSCPIFCNMAPVPDTPATKFYVFRRFQPSQWNPCFNIISRRDSVRLTGRQNSRTILSTKLPLPSFLPAYLPTCLPTYLHACLPASLPTYLPTYLPIYLPSSYLLASLPTGLPTYLPT